MRAYSCEFSLCLIAFLQYGCCDLTCAIHISSFQHYRGNEEPAYTSYSIVQNASPPAVTDGRKKEGLILLLGKLPHRVFSIVVSQNRDGSVVRTSLNPSAHAST